MYICIHTHIHIYTQKYIHIHLHTYAHTHTQTYTNLLEELVVFLLLFVQFLFQVSGLLQFISYALQLAYFLG